MASESGLQQLRARGYHQKDLEGPGDIYHRSEWAGRRVIQVTNSAPYLILWILGQWDSSGRYPLYYSTLYYDTRTSQKPVISTRKKLKLSGSSFIRDLGRHSLQAIIKLQWQYFTEMRMDN